MLFDTFISHLYFSDMHKQIHVVFDKVYSDLIKHVLVSTFKSLKKVGTINGRSLIYQIMSWKEGFF